MPKDIYTSANDRILVESKPLESTGNKASYHIEGILKKRKVFKIYRITAIPVCFAIVLCLIVSTAHAFNNTSSLNEPLSHDSAVMVNNQSCVDPVINGLAMFPYYRYNGNYYSLENASSDIQESISNHLYGDFYEIKGVDTSKSIALFMNKYYWRLDYAFKDTAVFNGKPYLIDADSCETPGKYLGEVDKYGVYESPDSDTSKAILVEIKDSYYCIAYQYVSSVKLNGITYELEPYKQKINNVNSEEYIGMAGSYKAYKYDNNDISKTIMIHINDTEEVVANATTTTIEDSLPVSNYGSPEESMYPLLQTVQWRGYGIYSLGSEDESGSLKKQLGKQIGNYLESGYNYEIYEMNGVDPSKSVIVKNNQVYFIYYFMFTDTIIFNGETYVIGDGNADYIKGDQIGRFGANNVYEIKGVDPDKVIDVLMSGPGFQGDFTAYKQDN